MLSLSWRNTLIETHEINNDEQRLTALEHQQHELKKGQQELKLQMLELKDMMSQILSRLTSEKGKENLNPNSCNTPSVQHLRDLSLTTDKMCDNGGGNLSKPLYQIPNFGAELKSIPCESRKVTADEFEEDVFYIYQLFDEIPPKTEIGGTVCEFVYELEENALDIYQVFVEMPKKNSKEDSSKILSANHSEQRISIDFYRGMMFNEDYLHLIVEERCVERHPEMLLPPPEPPDIPSIRKEKLIGNEEYLLTVSVHFIIHTSQLSIGFLQPSIARQQVRIFDIDGVDFCCHRTLCIMQFLDLVYMHVNMGGETFVDSCEPALEYSYITTVVHDCKGDSEALHFQFGFMLHKVVKIQIAYSSIRDQEGNILYLKSKGGLASISISMVFSSVLRTRLIAKGGNNVILEECTEVLSIKLLIKSYMGSTLFLSIHILALMMTRDVILESCSLNVQKSTLRTAGTIMQHLEVQTKKKGTVKKNYSWKYVNSVDLCFTFISVNVQDNNIQPLFFMIAVHMIPGSRYFPLRLKCMECPSGTFVPLASLVLDILEYKVAEEGGQAQEALSFASILKLLKYCQKLKNPKEECFPSSGEQLTLHFAQWSYHNSSPDLAIVPLIHLRHFYGIPTGILDWLVNNLMNMWNRVWIPTEILDCLVNYLMNMWSRVWRFLQENREDVTLSPHDHQPVEDNLNTLFTHFYKSVMDRAIARSWSKCGNISLL